MTSHVWTDRLLCSYDSLQSDDNQSGRSTDNDRECSYNDESTHG